MIHPAGAGALFKIDATSGVISTFARLPNAADSRIVTPAGERFPSQRHALEYLIHPGTFVSIVSNDL